MSPRSSRRVQTLTTKFDANNMLYLSQGNKHPLVLTMEQQISLAQAILVYYRGKDGTN